MTNPNVPVDGAKREQVAQQPAQAAAAPAAAQPAQKVAGQVDEKQAAEALNSTKPAAETKAQGADMSQKPSVQDQGVKDEEAAKQLKADRQEDQKNTEKLENSESSANENDDYFKKVAEDDKVFADPFREAYRLERQREEELAKGDPTRDPAAKQAAMDMNTPAPGALEEAEAMRQGKNDK